MLNNSECQTVTTSETDSSTDNTTVTQKVTDDFKALRKLAKGFPGDTALVPCTITDGSVNICDGAEEWQKCEISRHDLEDFPSMSALGIVLDKYLLLKCSNKAGIELPETLIINGNTWIFRIPEDLEEPIKSFSNEQFEVTTGANQYKLVAGVGVKTNENQQIAELSPALLQLVKNLPSPTFSPDLKTRLIEGLKIIPESWALTPISKDKKPYRKGWQKEKPVSHDFLIEEINKGTALGYGLRNGAFGVTLVTVDVDGLAGEKELQKLSKGNLPKTVEWTSGRQGRRKLTYEIPDSVDASQLKTRKITTNVPCVDDPTNKEGLELRFTGQDVLPPSVHPTTGAYYWINSPENTEIAEAPQWLIEVLSNKPKEAKKNSPTSFSVPVPVAIPIEKCLARITRQALNDGVIIGAGRNDTAVAIAKDLIGTADYLNQIGQKFDGDIEKIYSGYCNSSGLDIDTPLGQPEKCWDSAAKSNPGSSLSGGIIDNCIKCWFKKKDSRITEDVEYIEVPDGYLVKTTIEQAVYETVFEAGKGDWATFKSGFYRYNVDLGFWQQETDEKVSKLVGEELKKFCVYNKKSDKLDFKFFKATNHKSALSICRSTLAIPDVAVNNHLIAFKNGTFNIKTGELQPHSKSNFLTWGIDADYVPQSTCPEVFENFVNQVFGVEYLELIRAVVSMYLDPSAPYGYFTHIVGESGSGKGTFIRFLNSLFQESSVRSIAHFSELQSPEARHQHLTGVSVCSCPDSKAFQGNMTAFYELVDNGSYSGRALFSADGYQKKWNVRFILASTQMLAIENAGDGWNRRCIPLPTKARKGEIDLNLGDKLAACKAQVISWALGMDNTDRSQTIKTTTNFEPIAKLKRQQETFADSTKAFIDSCLYPSSTAEPMKDTALYDVYKAYCRYSNHKPKSLKSFQQDLGVILKRHKKVGVVKKIDGKAKRFPTMWVGIEINPELFEDANIGEFAAIKPDSLAEGALEAFSQVTWLHDENPGYMTEDFGYVTAESHTEQASQEKVTRLHDELPKVLEIKNTNNNQKKGDESGCSNNEGINDDFLNLDTLGSSSCNHVTFSKDVDTARNTAVTRPNNPSCNQPEQSCNHVTDRNISDVDSNYDTHPTIEF
jgi:phage/plasmid-associated DNA primase